MMKYFTKKQPSHQEHKKLKKKREKSNATEQSVTGVWYLRLGNGLIIHQMMVT
jgi:hypothetical protein